MALDVGVERDRLALLGFGECFLIYQVWNAWFPHFVMSSAWRSPGLASLSSLTSFSPALRGLAIVAGRKELTGPTRRFLIACLEHTRWLAGLSKDAGVGRGSWGLEDLGGCLDRFYGLREEE